MDPEKHPSSLRHDIFNQLIGISGLHSPKLSETEVILKIRRDLVFDVEVG